MYHYHTENIGPYAQLTFIVKCASKCATECILKCDDILNAYLAAHLEVSRYFLCHPHFILALLM